MEGKKSDDTKQPEVPKEIVTNPDNDGSTQPGTSIEPTNLASSVEEFFGSPGFYANAKKYWSNIPPTINGMLGGLSVIDRTDIQGSTGFLNDLHAMLPIGKERALDCGAGIGRVTKNLLVKFYGTVDLVEQDANFVRKAHEYLNTNGSKHPNVGEIYNEGLQNFTPSAGQYDVIWSQWVLGHLTDDDLRAFLKRCVLALKPNGCIVIKENCSIKDDFRVDDMDSSVTRSLRVMCYIIKRAGLRIAKLNEQMNFIKGLFPVFSFACVPNPIDSPY